MENGLLYGKSSGVLDPNGYLTRAEMAAVINRSFGTYKTTDVSGYTDVSPQRLVLQGCADGRLDGHL